MLQYRLEDHPHREQGLHVMGETLAVADVRDKAKQFVLRCDYLILVVDHKPLIKLFNDRSLGTSPTPD